MKKHIYKTMAAMLLLSLVSVPFSPCSKAFAAVSDSLLQKDIGFRFDGMDWTYLGAFENNSIRTLNLGTYTSHIGDKAFRDNFIEKLETSPRQEEIGISAFENNLISELHILGWMEGYDDGLTEIPDDAFRGNRLSEAVLPPEITEVSESAFRDNVSAGRFIVESDNENIRPTTGYDVRRSDGTVLRYKGE